MKQAGSLALAICMTATFTVLPVGVKLQDSWGIALSAAHAGNGNGNGNGNSGGGNGKSESRGSSGRENSGSSSRSKSGSTKSDDTLSTALGKFFGTAKATEKRTGSKKTLTETATVSPAVGKAVLKAPKPLPKPETKILTAEVPEAEALAPKRGPGLAAKLGGLNSLDRNYHAYLNSSDPRMAAIRDYVLAYAQFELANGVDAVPTDPALGDEALSAALIAAANKDIGTVTQPGDVVVTDPEVIAWAKDVLGVGPSIGKIDEVREALGAEQPVEEPIDEFTEAEATVTPVTTPLIVVE